MPGISKDERGRRMLSKRKTRTSEYESVGFSGKIERRCLIFDLSVELKTKQRLITNKLNEVKNDQK